MTRLYHTFFIEDNTVIKQQILSWSSKFNTCCFLDNQQYLTSYNSFECLLGVGIHSKFEPGYNFLSSLSTFIQNNKDWILGHFNYEIGDVLMGHDVHHTVNKHFPDTFLFVPKVLIFLTNKELTIGVENNDAELIFSEILQEPIITPASKPVEFTGRISRDEYVSTIRKLKDHIQKGDCYEINFCQEFYANSKINPLAVFSKLINISPNPFSAYYRINDNYLLCASPERYLKKIGSKIISQPIKGTGARSKLSENEDVLSKQLLMQSEKDKTENVMIVDLVRNDLSKICRKGSVEVEELFGIYSYPHVHQMVSTVTGILKEGIDFSAVLNATFPMGSMTGAPKKKVMELIDKYEESERGIFSGTVGYITPERNVDFNVVIRSLVYNETTDYLSFHVGSAITASSEPEKEYEECLLKVTAILSLFS